MWTVLSQKRKAIPGLAQILLALVLIACLFFAYGVQRFKQRHFRLDLDRTIHLSTRAGDLALKASSRWNELPPDQLVPGMIAGWTIPLPAGGGTAALFLDVISLQPSQRNDLLLVIGRYLEVHRLLLRTLRIEEGLPVQSLPTVDVATLYTGQQDVKALVMKLIYLPDGASLILLTLGPQRSANTLGFWLDQLARNLEFRRREIRGDTHPNAPDDGGRLRTSRPIPSIRAGKEYS